MPEREYHRVAQKAAVNTMTRNPRECPECGCIDTEVVHTEFMRDEIGQVVICNDCPAQWTVSYADPIIRDVVTVE